MTNPKPSPHDPKEFKSELDHPCRETCSGWKQGYAKGLEGERAKYESGIRQRMRFAQKNVDHEAEIERLNSLVRENDHYTMNLKAEHAKLLSSLRSAAEALGRKDNAHAVTCAIFDDEYYGVPNPCTCENAKRAKVLATLRAEHPELGEGQE